MKNYIYIFTISDTITNEGKLQFNNIFHSNEEDRHIAYCDWLDTLIIDEGDEITHTLESIHRIEQVGIETNMVKLF